MWQDRVLFIDGEALVIDKPAGLAVHPGARTPESLEDHLRHLRFGFQRLPHPVHRLNRDTSGCLLLSRNPKAHKKFAQAFEGGVVRKAYLAVLDGVPSADEGTVDMPLAKISSAEAGWRMVNAPSGKRAVSHWRVVAVKGARALVHFTPETGRTHQLRVHAADALGIPIVGDPIYGPPTSSRRARGPMLLHAWTLALDRPGKETIEAKAPLPPSFPYAGFGNAPA